MSARSVGTNSRERDHEPADREGARTISDVPLIDLETNVALDALRLDEIARLADLASSYWRSISLAADRGNKLTVVTHCRQVAAITREAFAVARALGSPEVQP
jgi:hypothetical protein